MDRNRKVYFPISVKTESIQGGNSILTGSCTTTQITIAKENVSVEPMEKDTAFDDAGFGDISF